MRVFDSKKAPINTDKKGAFADGNGRKPPKNESCLLVICCMICLMYVRLPFLYMNVSLAVFWGNRQEVMKELESVHFV